MEQEPKYEYPYMGPRPGAPAEGSPVQLQLAEAVRNAAPAPLSKTGIMGPESDLFKMPKSTG
jgi:hypothetical protein